ncbi:O-antigen ligase family protein [Pseudomonas sp. BE134]|uniref:O-antigen ligase family protein n=1 Tax=Pseudomonas sp. BE134 TaxID=2817843 RepID=UPI00285C154C|nr:O-antigen ligase family protein [Pseudomonas sp. BE134]MDR6925613.1 tetrahydromethanopterin S-methyltransferase subunit F [Pseudomonas sp. BE134]
MPPGKIIGLLLGLVFGVLLWALPPMKVIFVVIGLAVTLTLVRKPLWGLLIFAVLATSIPYTTLELGIRTTVSEAVLGLTWLGVFWQSFIGQTRNLLLWRPTERAMAWLMLFSIIPFIAGMIIIHADGNGPVNWVRWLMNLSLLFMVPLLLRSDADRDKLVIALLLGNLAMLLLSVFMFIKTRNAMSMIPILTDLKYAHPEAVQDIFSANYQRMASPWVHPNLTGGVLVLFIPMALLYGWTQSGFRRALGLAVAILGCAGLLLSISRGAILALALVLLWLTYKRVPYSGRIIGIGAAFAVALVMFYPPLQERLMTIFSASNASTEIRFDEYSKFPDAMARFPLGIGFKLDPPIPGSGLPGISNLWLNFIYKIGIPGMLLFVTVTVLWWREVRPVTDVRQVTRENALWLGCIAGLLAALLTGLFDHYFSFTFVLIGLFWLLMGLSLQQVRLRPSIILPFTPKESPV